MKPFALVAALILCVGRPAAAATLFTICESNLLSPEAVDRRLESILEVVKAGEEMRDYLSSAGKGAAEAIVTIASVTEKPLLFVRNAYDGAVAKLKAQKPVAAMKLGEEATFELVLMAMDLDLSVSGIIDRLADMRRALGPRIESIQVTYALMKCALYYKRNPYEVADVLEEVRRALPEIERRIDDKHAATRARHPDSYLKSTGAWITDELMMATIEAAVGALSRKTVTEALAVLEEVLGDEVGALYTGHEQEAIIKAAVILDRPVEDSLNRLASFEARTLARFGDHVDEEIEPFLIYAMLLGGRDPKEMVDFIDHLSHAVRPHSDLVGLEVLLRSTFDLVRAAPRRTVLKAALFNPFH